MAASDEWPHSRDVVAILRLTSRVAFESDSP
jgi:hypothetical protein